LRCKDSNDRLIVAERSKRQDKTLETTKTAVKDNKNVPDSQRVESDCILFLLLSMVMLDFTWWPDAEEEAGKKPTFLPTTPLHAFQVSTYLV
jgi:hypothetical protein